jgi:hypothetical protein
MKEFDVIVKATMEFRFTCKAKSKKAIRDMDNDDDSLLDGASYMYTESNGYDWKHADIIEKGKD